MLLTQREKDKMTNTINKTRVDVEDSKAHLTAKSRINLFIMIAVLLISHFLRMDLAADFQHANACFRIYGQVTRGTIEYSSEYDLFSTFLTVDMGIGR